MSNKDIFKIVCTAMIAVGFAACSSDEPAEGVFPEGKYPLEIASVTMSVEGSEQPWSADVPQTRVSESTDRNSSVWNWDGTEQIGVQLYSDGDVVTYTLGEGNKLTANQTLYWQNTQETTINAWYPMDNEVVSLADQSDNLAYILKGSWTGDYKNPVTLNFTHQLAKVRVVLSEKSAAQVKDVKIYSYTSCVNDKGTVNTDGASEGWITMQETTYNNGTKCWEANVVPGHKITKLQIDGITTGALDGGGITPQVAKINTITVNTEIKIAPSDGTETLDLENGDVVNITGNGTSTTGSFVFNIATGNTATVILNNVNMDSKVATESIPGNAYSAFKIDGGGTIIFKLNGTNTITRYWYGIKGLSNGTAANIHVEGSGTLNITGENICSAIATDHGKEIFIKNATIAMNGTFSGGGLPGAAIGSGSVETCGDITIIRSKIDIKMSVSFIYKPYPYYGAAIGTGVQGNCGNIKIVLKDNQSKTDFLNKIIVTDDTGGNNSLTNANKIGKGFGGTSCGSITWLESDGTTSAE